MREISKKFDDLIYDKHLTPKCVSNLKEFIADIMRDLLKSLEKQSQRPNGKVQLLSYLLKYYNYIKNLSATSEQSRTIAINNDYQQRHTIVSDFNQVTLSTEQTNLLIEEVANIQA